MTVEELTDREGAEVVGRLAWFPCLSAEELQWLAGISELGVQVSVLPEDDGLSVYRVDR